MPSRIASYEGIGVGEVFEDCAYHPCLCVKIDAENDEIVGVSLIDGSFPRCCSIKHCGIRKLSIAEALEWKVKGPKDVKIEPHKKWWTQI